MILIVATMSTGHETAGRITEAIFAIVADQGLDAATVREVARVAGVSIGAVQHHFPTKDAMLAGAFTDVVRRVRARLERIEYGDDARRNLLVVLEEILPLDPRRSSEARVQLAFAVRAMHEPALAVTQRAVLSELHEALSRSLASTGAGVTLGRSRSAAHGALALADGLALHALSTGGWLSDQSVRQALEQVIETLTTPHDIR